MERMLRRHGNGGRKAKKLRSLQNGIRSTETVTWDPFSVLPKEIYVKIFDKLENPTDKQNFMNAHIKWYELFKACRVLFLSQQVFKVVGVADNEPWRWGRGHSMTGPRLHYEEEEGEKYKDLTSRDFNKCRLVCRDWDKGIQNYFQLHDNRFNLDGGVQIWNSDWRWPIKEDDKDVLVPCKSFNWTRAEPSDAEKDFERFSPVTHPPSKNPILSRSAILSPFPATICFRSPAMPPLDSPYLQRYRDRLDALLERYGRHIWHCKIKIEQKLFPETGLQIAKWLRLMPELKTLDFEYDKAVCFYHPFTLEDLENFETLQIQQPELNKLLVLKSSNLPSVVFNKLFGELPDLKKIQIVTFTRVLLNESALRDFMLPINRRNLSEAFFTVKGLPDFEYLYEAEPFPNLKSLVITLEYETFDEYLAKKLKKYEKPVNWPEWRLVWNILEEKFPALEKLTLRLPKATIKDEKKAIQQSLECRLNLKKLKKLWVAMPNLSSLDFILPCKALEEVEIVLEHSQWNSEESRRLGMNEKVDFNSFLKSMWQSNIWEEFPKMRKLEIKWLGKEKLGGLLVTGNVYRYEKNGYEKKFSHGRFKITPTPIYFNL